jgi:hypothetical protein
VDEAFELGAGFANAAPEGGQKIGVLQFGGIAEAGFQDGGAVLEGSVQLGDVAEEVALDGVQLAFPFEAPLGPMRADVADFEELAEVGSDGVEARGEAVEARGESGLASAEGLDGLAVLVERIDAGGQGGEGAVVLIEGFEDGAEPADGGAVEIDLVADVPIEEAGDEFLDRLDGGIQQAGRARVDATDGGDLGFGGVALVEDGQQVGEDDARAGDALGIARADAVADFPDNGGELFGHGAVGGGVGISGHVSGSR